MGYCFPCGDYLKRENALQLHAHNGPAFKRWRRKCIAALGGVPSEEVEAVRGDAA